MKTLVSNFSIVPHSTVFDASLEPVIISSGGRAYKGTPINIDSSHWLIRIGKHYGVKDVLRAARRHCSGTVQGNDWCMGKFEFDGHRISTKAQCLNLFYMKGTTCVLCGITGTFFRKERHIKTDVKEGRFMLSLYAHALVQYTVPVFGNVVIRRAEVRMTRDHIIPISKGGADNLTNLQPMCVVCNTNKDDSIGDI